MNALEKHINKYIKLKKIKDIPINLIPKLDFEEIKEYLKTSFNNSRSIFINIREDILYCIKDKITDMLVKYVCEKTAKKELLLLDYEYNELFEIIENSFSLGENLTKKFSKYLIKLSYKPYKRNKLFEDEKKNSIKDLDYFIIKNLENINLDFFNYEYRLYSNEFNLLDYLDFTGLINLKDFYFENEIKEKIIINKDIYLSINLLNSFFEDIVYYKYRTNLIKEKKIVIVGNRNENNIFYKDK